MAVLTLIALLLGPTIAVCITLWWQDRKERRDAKLRLFTTLMVHRKFLTPTYDWVNALNLIDVVFADNDNVVKLWHELYTLYQTSNTTAETLNHKYIDLLSAMAKVLHFRKLQQTDIDKFYYPTAHGKQLEAQSEAQAEWLRVLKKTDHFLVEARAPEAASAPDIPDVSGPPTEPFERR
jgi:Family of unknown function (DUF6680)